VLQIRTNQGEWVGCIFEGNHSPVVFQCIHEATQFLFAAIIANALAGTQLSRDDFRFVHTDVAPDMPEPTDVCDAASIIRKAMS
jgi:hypothetical protein